MKKDDKEIINVWEKVIELTEDGEVVGYYFQFKKRIKRDEEVKKDDKPRGSHDKR